MHTHKPQAVSDWLPVLHNDCSLPLAACSIQWLIPTSRYLFYTMTASYLSLPVLHNDCSLPLAACSTWSNSSGKEIRSGCRSSIIFMRKCRSVNFWSDVFVLFNWSKTIVNQVSKISHSARVRVYSRISLLGSPTGLVKSELSSVVTELSELVSYSFYWGKSLGTEQMDISAEDINLKMNRQKKLSPNYYYSTPIEK